MWLHNTSVLPKGLNGSKKDKRIKTFNTKDKILQTNFEGRQDEWWNYMEWTEDVTAVKDKHKDTENLGGKSQWLYFLKSPLLQTSGTSKCRTSSDFLEVE